jgi:hypothetical protein
MPEPPTTYRVDPGSASDELDYVDMVALSDMFCRWAINEDPDKITPERRTWPIELSADYERIAEWVGPDWRAANPSDESSIMKFLEVQERNASAARLRQ